MLHRGGDRCFARDDQNGTRFSGFRAGSLLEGGRGSPQNGARPRCPGTRCCIGGPEPRRSEFGTPLFGRPQRRTIARPRPSPPPLRTLAKYHVPERVRFGLDRDKNAVGGEKLPQIRETGRVELQSRTSVYRQDYVEGSLV